MDIIIFLLKILIRLNNFASHCKYSNLLSVAKLIDENYQVNFVKKESIIKNNNNIFKYKKVGNAVCPKIIAPPVFIVYLHFYLLIF